MYKGKKIHVIARKTIRQDKGLYLYEKFHVYGEYLSDRIQKKDCDSHGGLSMRFENTAHF